MNFRLYPHPTDSICTPFVYVRERNAYSRYFFVGSSLNLISITNKVDSSYIFIVGGDEKTIIGERRPNREMILDYLLHCESVSKSFLDYVKNTFVIPSFPLSKEEAFVKTIIRQIINAKQAKKMFSNFVKEFGYKKDGLYSFPNLEQLERVSIYDFRKFGLGFKAERMWSGIRILKTMDKRELTQINGIGSWSKNILEVEAHKNYSLYPFGDKSGEKIKNICGIDLIKIARKSNKFAGDLYVYAASYMEFIR